MASGEPHPVPLETVLGGKYRVDRLLGTGGFGAVYLATQLDLNRQVAVKVLHAEGVSADLLARFQREARATGALGHPHIVQVSDFQLGPPPFLVMEYLRGRSLAGAMRPVERLDPRRAVRIALQVLSALEATHRIGIVHRDIKPANLMLIDAATEEDFVKVLDFGIAKDLSVSETQATESGAVLGTLGYMAPEQALGLSIDERADLYAVGGVLYRMLAGVTPTQAENVGQLMRILAHGSITPLVQRAPELPPALNAAVTRALEHDPEKRFPDATSLALALAASVGLPPPAWIVARDPSRNSWISPHSVTRTSDVPRGSAETHPAPYGSIPPPQPGALTPMQHAQIHMPAPSAAPAALPHAPQRSSGATTIIVVLVALVALLLVGFGALAAFALWEARSAAKIATSDAGAPAASVAAASPSSAPAASASSAPIAKASPGGPAHAATSTSKPAPPASTPAPVAQGVLDKNGKCKCVNGPSAHILCQFSINTSLHGICLYSGPVGAPCSGFDGVTGDPATGNIKCN